MFTLNKYYDGNVQSLSFLPLEGKATIGVIAPGEYSFNTNNIEYMTVISGIMHVRLPGDNNWRSYKPFETFVVQAGKTFDFKVDADVAYKCLYK